MIAHDGTASGKCKEEPALSRRSVGQLGVVAVVWVCVLVNPAHAAITNYSGDELGFEAAIAGLSWSWVDFEDGRVALGDPIDNQYAAENILFSSPFGITANSNGAGTPALGTLCADVGRDDDYSEWAFTLPDPVWGVSFVMLDVNNSGGYTDISVFDPDGNMVGSFTQSKTDTPTDPFDAYDYIALVSDSRNIGRIEFRAGALDAQDARGFDNVKIVPEPAALALLLFGGTVVSIRRRRGMRPK